MRKGRSISCCQRLLLTRPPPPPSPLAQIWVAAAATTDAVGRACAEWGAFHVVNHGAPAGLLDAMRAAGLAFFRAPMAEKLRFGCDPARGAAAEGYGSRMLAKDGEVRRKKNEQSARKQR